MAKNKTEGNHIPGNFLAVNKLLKRKGLDAHEQLIISEIQSWNRQNKKFYASIAGLALDYECDRKVIMRRIEGLIEKGLITKGEKKYNNQYEYRVNEQKLMIYLKEYKKSSCTSEEQPIDQAVPQENSSCTSEVHNNKPKNINKNILRGGEDVPSSSLPKTSLTDEAFAEFLNEI